MISQDHTSGLPRDAGARTRYIVRSLVDLFVESVATTSRVSGPRPCTGLGCWPGLERDQRPEGFYTACPAHRVRFVPSSRLETFPCTSMISLPELILEPCVSPLQLAYLPSSRGLRPRFFDRAFSDPLCAALRHVVRCDEYRPSRRGLDAGLGAPVRSAACTTELNAGVAAYLLPPGRMPRFAWPPRFQGHYHSLPFSLALILCVLRVSRVGTPCPTVAPSRSMPTIRTSRVPVRRGSSEGRSPPGVT